MVDLSKILNTPTLDSARALTQHLQTITPVADLARRLENSYGIQKMLKDMESHQAYVRAAIGPIEELKRMGVFDSASPLREEMDRIRQISAAYDAQFRLPDMSIMPELKRQLDAISAATPVLHQLHDLSTVQHAMDAMRSPWLHTDVTRSLTHFAELQGIGQALAGMPAFNGSMTAALRLDLGDWRDAILWPDPIFTDPVARAEFYVGRGFNPALTDFPAKAFQESVEIAGLRRRPPLIALYDPPVPDSDDPREEDGLRLTNQAHEWLLRFETRLRQFIDEAMTEAFGASWPRHRLPNGLHDKWQDKKSRMEQGGGRQWPLIAYADFTDYAEIICRGDNWRDLFKTVFGRPESVRESFQRLYPIRICTMHARPITQDDQLFLYVEMRRLMQAIGEGRA